MVEAEPLEEVIQRDAGDTDLPGAVDDVDEVGAAGLRMGEEKLGKGPRVARQEVAVGPVIQAVMDRLDDLLGGEPRLPRHGRAVAAEEACDLCDLEAGAAVQQEVAEDAA